MDQFYILPEKDPEKAEGNEPTTFYVMEGELEQYRCSSREEAIRLKDGLVKNKDKRSTEARKLRKTPPELYEFDGVLIAAMGTVSNQILKTERKGIATSKETMLPPYRPVSTTNAQPDPTPELAAADQSIAVKNSKKSKFDPS